MGGRQQWTEGRLGNYAYIKARIGWRGLSADEYTHDGPYLIAGNHIHNGQINWSLCDHISNYRYQESWEIALEEKDVILTKDGTIGRVAFVNRLPGLVTINGTMMLVRAQSPLVPKFVYHYLTGERFQKLVTEKVSGSSIPHIFQRDLVELSIPILPEEEQHRIAEILDTADAAIRQAEAHIAKLKQIKDGMLHDLLTRGIDAEGCLRDPVAHPEQFKDSSLGRIPREWEIRSLEDKLERVIDYRGKTPEKTERGIPLITAKNVRNGYLDPEPREYINPITFDAWMTRGIPREGDVLFTTEGPLGNVARVPGYKLAVGQRIITLCSDPGVLDADYLFWLLLWENSYYRIEQQSTGSTVVGIKASIFRKIPFQFPPVQEQRKIAAILNTHDTLIKTKEARLAKLRQVKQGLMHDLLTGRVRV